MDRNQIIGLSLIAILFAIYVYITPTPQPQATVIADTLKATPGNRVEAPALPDSVLAVMNAQKYGAFSNAASGKQEYVTLKNKELQITLNTKGGSISEVKLNEFKSFDGKDLILGNEKNFSQDLILRLTTKDINTSELYFTPILESDSVVRMRIAVDKDNYFDKVYTLNASSGYVLGYRMEIIGLQSILSSKPMVYEWKANLPKLEYDDTKARELATVTYYQPGEGFDDFTPTSLEPNQKTLTKPTQWFGFKHKFFTSACIAKNPMPVVTLKNNVDLSDTTGIEKMEARMEIPVADARNGASSFKLFFGPNKLDVCKNITDGFEENVEMGWPIVRVINRYIVVPVFSFFSGFISNYGIIIIILVILLRLILLPLGYKSHIAMAKMKVLKPELDEIKERFPDDLQKQQGEQMQLYQKFGINPLSGCIPLLLQMPILFAMFSFFPSAFELRQQSFLWASDLSSYDHPIELGFTIPFYGSHISIFTILMTISTLVYTWYNNQMSTMQGPYKIVSYIMPLIFLFVLNTMPAGLSFYYLMSNIASIAQQLIIRRFVDEGAIRAKLDENKKNYQAGTGKKSKFQSWMENAMKAQEEAKKNQKKK
ncbi:MAG: membrane protein insertase YidC [Cytophagaceae bacterium]|jgi:YidC/Oxa1 family membrane protein insertase|nr:membrane protein insertase YidC [Cytophagaceae bacterium]